MPLLLVPVPDEPVRQEVALSRRDPATPAEPEPLVGG